jgi:DNA-binding MarR family transcriptional regulator
MENRSLLHIMEKCGHFLYHRRGGKRGQIRILKLLSEKGNITQKELLEILTLKSGSVSETVKKLENQGYITKKKDEQDKRKVIITLTDEGRSFLEAQLKINSEQEKVLFNSLTADEQAELEELLNKLFIDWEEKFDKSLFNHRKEE